MYLLYGPRSHACLYLVRNKKTGQVYVGQTVDMRRRYAEWRSIVASSGLRAPNQATAEAIKSSDPNDWVLEIFMECQPSDLKRGEERLIAKLTAKLGPLCLNVPDVAGARKKRSADTLGSVPLSEVRDEHDTVMSYAQVAARLGITMDSVQERLRRLRRVGRFKFSIKDLPARQQRLPQKS